MVIITASPNDVHALAVARRLQDAGENCCILNPADYPSRCHMHASYCHGSYDYTIEYGGHTIKASDVKGLWLRRFHSHEIHPQVSDEEIRRFTYDECREFFQGWASNVPNVINANRKENLALRKVHQLKIAQEVGLRVPETIVSNNPSEIERFCRSASYEVVYKMLTHSAFGFYGTQTVDEEKLARLDACEYSPTIFQERIAVKQNLRVTVVDDQVFAAEIQTTTDRADLDWRLDMTPLTIETTLPSDVTEKLLRLQDRLGLRYGAIDLIRNHEDEYVFLENNPGGQFLFVEIATGQRISQAIANALTGARLDEVPAYARMEQPEGAVV